MKKILATTAIALATMTGSAMAGDGITVCLITKTDTNPFFVKMKEGAEAKAAELGMTLKSFAGKVDGDHETQVAAIETCIADGAKGILITASDTSSIVTAVTQARDAGLVVIALDTPLNPIDAADATFATDNFIAGELIGKWAKGQMGDGAADAKSPCWIWRSASQPLACCAIRGSCRDLALIWAIPTNGVMKPMPVSLATTSPLATKRAGAKPWKTFWPKTR